MKNLIIGILLLCVSFIAVYKLAEKATFSRQPPDTVLLRKNGAVVMCEIRAHEECGLTLNCGDATVMYCMTNVETTVTK